MGRPSTYTDEIAAAICERLSAGESLRSILRDEAMPAWGSVWRWLRDKPEFAAQYARAREDQARCIFEEVLEIADTPMPGTIETTKEWGVEVKTADMIEHRRLQVDARKWALARMMPKVYGDAHLLKHADADGNRLAAAINLTIADS